MLFTVITNGDFPDSLPQHTLEQIQSSEIIVADGGLKNAWNLGLNPRVWIGDGDSTDKEDLKAFKAQGGRVQKLDPYKDYTDTEEALRFAQKSGASEMILLGGSGGRFDHLFANFFLFNIFPALKTWITPWESMRVIERNYQISIASGTVLSFIPLNEDAQVASSQGLEWPLEKWDFMRGISLSNMSTGEKITIRMESGRLLLVKPKLT
jgi:thiamine pyrophosphokinase